MKYALALVALLASLSQAYTIEGNPDKSPSLGLEYSGASLKGDTQFSNFTFTTKPETKETINNFMGDMRFPVNNSLTFNVGLGYGQHKIESFDGTVFPGAFSSAILVIPTTTDMSGPLYKVGARIYFK